MPPAWQQLRRIKANLICFFNKKKNCRQTVLSLISYCLLTFDSLLITLRTFLDDLDGVLFPAIGSGRYIYPLKHLVVFEKFLISFRIKSGSSSNS